MIALATLISIIFHPFVSPGGAPYTLHTRHNSCIYSAGHCLLLPIESPRDVLLVKRDSIDFDLHTRQLQWTEQGEGPPCLAPDSFAYRFAGFGTHECVLYYDLVRHLLWNALHFQNASEPVELKTEIARLEEIKSEWLENPQEDSGGRIPAIIIENERRRLPNALQARDMIIDEDCELCVMSANEVAMGYGPGFLGSGRLAYGR